MGEKKKDGVGDSKSEHVTEKWWQRSEDQMRAQVAVTMNECRMSG